MKARHGGNLGPTAGVQLKDAAVVDGRRGALLAQGWVLSSGCGMCCIVPTEMASPTAPACCTHPAGMLCVNTDYNFHCFSSPLELHLSPFCPALSFFLAILAQHVSGLSSEGDIQPVAGLGSAQLLHPWQR